MKTLAKHIMSTEMITVPESSTVEEALKILVTNQITGAPVLDQSGLMQGVVSEYDVLEQLSGAYFSEGSFALEIFSQVIQYSKNARSIDEETPLNDIVNLFIDSKYRRLPVVNKAGELVGMISRRDLMRLFYYRTRIDPHQND